MDENRESQELAIPGKIVKSERKGGIAQTVRNILRKPATQAITKAPKEQAPTVEQAPEEMSVERAREILEYIVGIDEKGLDMHEGKLSLSPAEQERLKRFGSISYQDIQKAFGVYANHLVTTHGIKEPNGYYQYRLLKEDVIGPPQIVPPEVADIFMHKTWYYDLELAIMLDFEKPKTPKAVQLTLYDDKNHGLRKVQSRIPIVDVEPWSSDDMKDAFWDIFSLSDPITPHYQIMQSASFSSVNKSNIGKDSERFQKFKLIHRGMRWTAANLLCWDENRIVYPNDLDRPPLDKPPFDKGQAQLNKPKLELPPNKSSGISGNSGNKLRRKV